MREGIMKAIQVVLAGGGGGEVRGKRDYSSN
jgi:hypothetical protein